MAGHNKWSKIKRKKAIEDKKRGKIFSGLSKAIEIAARKGGDASINPELRSAIDEAKSVNMPLDSIERAIKKGTGEFASTTPQQERYYEAYGPGGVALLIRTTTNNVNRTSAELKHILSTHQTSLADAGSVTWIFDESWGNNKLQMIPKNTVSLSMGDAEKLERLTSDIEKQEDVEQVFTNRG